ncbi:ribosome biogenesis protein 15 [Acrasis kona]|uniref:Ribosome biogenesis protein 15 n=1 Tax=Acrasis kona TaxID=1008807 RepID=A0AAW2ZFD0_9EUKA
MKAIRKKVQAPAKVQEKKTKQVEENSDVTETENVTPSHDEVKKKLQELRSKSEALKQNMEEMGSDQDSDSDSDDEQAPSKAFSLYPTNSLGEHEDDIEDLDDIEPENTTIVIRKLPHGFYEKEIRTFFSAVAPVSNVRVVRNPKTGNSRGCAYVQFSDEETAKVVAEELDYYLLLNKVIRVQLTNIPAFDQKRIFNSRFDELHKLTQTSSRKTNQLERLAVIGNKTAKSKAEVKGIVKKRSESLLSKQRKWEQKGIKFSLPNSNKK